MLFSNACVTNSICAPSRATILTGKHCHLHGKIDNRFPFDTTQVTFPQLFQAAGYQTAMFGKLHFGNNPKGIDEFKILPGQGAYYNPDFDTNDGRIRIEGYTTDVITDITMDWMKNRRDPDLPFLLFFLHKAPHREWLPAERHYKEFTKMTFPEPPTLFDDYEGRGSAAREAEMNILLHQNWAGDSKLRPEVLDELGITPASNWDKRAMQDKYNRFTEEQLEAWNAVYDPIIEDFKQRYPTMTEKEQMSWKYQRYMQDYLGSIAAVDEGVGVLLDYLDEAGLSENTIVVYTSDQGFYLGEHGWFDKRFIYDESFKTPLLVKWPTVEPGSKNDQMVQNMDFAQTFLDIAGIEAPSDMQGESIVPLLKSPEREVQVEAIKALSLLSDESHAESIRGILRKIQQSEDNTMINAADTALKSLDDRYSETVVAQNIRAEKVAANTKTLLVENEKNIWLTPPRNFLFKTLELSPYPFIMFPADQRRPWRWDRKISDKWSNPRWLDWKGTSISSLNILH